MRRCMFALMLCCMSVLTMGQKSYLALQAGINISKARGEEIFDETKYSLKPVVGINYTLNFKQLVFNADLLYNTLGFKDEIMLTNNIGEFIGTFDSEFSHRYISLPIKFGYSFGDKIKVIPKLGVQPSVLVDEEITYPIFDNQGTLTGKETANNDANPSKDFDFSGLLELEVNYSLNDDFLFFSSVSRKQSFTTFWGDIGEIDPKYHAFSLLVGIKYCISK